MRLESNEDQLRLSRGRDFPRRFENPLMTKMHAVEISDGHHGSLGGFEEAVQAVEKLHWVESISADGVGGRVEG